MSATIPESIEIPPEYAVRSKRGEPTWEIAYQFPIQGEWTEEEYLALDIGRIVEFTDGVVEFLPDEAYSGCPKPESAADSSSLESRPKPKLPSQRGEPTWEIAYAYPYQGEWSEEQYLALDTGRLVEFTDGVLEFLPMPNLKHQDIMLFLRDLLKAYVEAHGLGRVYVAPSPVRLRDGKFREPDVFLLKHERIKSRTSPPDGADLVIEIVSEGRSSRERDLVRKPEEYAEACIPEYWVIDPEEKKIIVFTLDSNEYRTHGEFTPGQAATSPLLPGFEVAVTDVFAAGEDVERT